MYDTLVILATVVSVPLLLLGLRAAFAWRYRRLVRESMRSASTTDVARTESASTPAPGGPSPLALAYIRPSDVQLSGAAREIAADADATTRSVERAAVAAAVVYVAMVSVGVNAAFEPDVPLDARLVANYLLLAPILLIVSSVLSFTARRAGVIAASYVIIGMAGLAAFAGATRTITLVNAWRDFFLILPIAGLALLVLRRLRPLLIALTGIAVYLLIAFVAAAVMSELGMTTGPVRWWLWPVGALNMLLGFVVFAWLLGRPSPQVPVAALAAAAAIGALVEWQWSPKFPIGAILVGLASHVFQVYVLWQFFRVFVWFQDRHLLPGQLLHAHVLFGFLTFYLVVLFYVTKEAALFGDKTWPLVTIGTAFVCQAAILHVLLRRIWQERRTRPGKRLLLLRSFGAIKGRERLLDGLENTWRRVGRIDLIGAADLAMHTIGSRMLEAFLLQRVDKQFVKTDQDGLLRLRQLRSSLEGDVRYPINEIYCQGAIWQRVVRELAAGADAVLMDLRGFTIANKGCAFELRELVHRVRLRRIVLLADETTDMQALEQVARSAWLDAPAESPNAGDASPRLGVLRAAGSRTSHSSAHAAMLYEAAAEPGPGIAPA